MINTLPAVPADAFELTLREEDTAEVSPGWQEGVALAIKQYGGTAFRDREGHLVALLGVTGGGGTLSPWLLCSPRVGAYRRFAVPCARRVVSLLRERAGTGTLVYNFIPKHSHGNRRFVEALGFQILPSPRDGFDFFYLPHV